MKIKFIPKGSMCANCMFALSDCGKLDFKSMRQLETLNDGVIVVRCFMFARVSNERHN